MTTTTAPVPTTELDEADRKHLEAVVRAAREARRQGEAPFAARLVGADGSVLAEAVNRVRSGGDPTAHAEINVLRRIAHVPKAQLPSTTLYSNVEPCAMCAAAICWTSVGRVVYAISHQQMRALSPSRAREPGTMGAQVFAATVDGPSVVGPVRDVGGNEPFL